jgi:hypothetical protein
MYAVSFENAVPGPPQGVRVLPVNISCLQVWWRPPLDTEKRELIRAYKITVREVVPEVSDLRTFSLDGANY